MRRWILSCVLAAGLLASACSEEPTFDPQSLGESLADQLQNRYPAAVTATDGACVGSAVVAAFTAERLEQLGLSAESVRRGTALSEVGLLPREADDVVDAYLDCLPLADVLASELLSDGFGSESSACVSAAVTDDVLDEFASSLVSGADRDQRTGAVLDLYRSCFDQAELAVWLDVDGPSDLALAIGDSIVAASPELVTDAAAACLGDGVVEFLGVERMDQLGLSIESIDAGAGVTTVALTPEEIAGVADLALGCFSYRELLLDQVDRVTIDARCVDAGLTDDLLRSAVIEAFSAASGDEAATAVADLYRACLRSVLALVPPGGSLAFADVVLDEDQERRVGLIGYHLAVAATESPFSIVEPEAATCVAAQAVVAIGLARLDELDLTDQRLWDGAVPADAALSPADVDAFTEAVYQCVDARGAFARRLVDDADIGAPALGCLADALPSSLVAEAARAAGTGRAHDPELDPAYAAVVVEVFTECLDDATLLLLGDELTEEDEALKG